MAILSDEDFKLELISSPELHRHHDLFELQTCCAVDGTIDAHRFDLHSRLVDMGTNGGRRCDVAIGPCACGAWH